MTRHSRTRTNRRQFLKTTTYATVLASPQINIEDNETGKLFVGQQIPFIDNSVIQAQGGQNNSFTYKDVGVILEVTPHINNSGDVSLKVHAESSSLSGQTILNGAVVDTRNFKTDLEAKSGQTLVLGGIIQRQVSDTLRKSIDEVSKLQEDASRAVEDAMTGKTDNVSGVMTAVEKSDLAFKTLLAIRSKLMEAYEEIKAIQI